MEALILVLFLLIMILLGLEAYQVKRDRALLQHVVYGRRRFAVMILLAFTIDLIIASSEILPYDPGIIGVLVPGIIANELERQGAVKSLMSLAVVVGILALIMMGMGMQVFRV